MATIYGASLYQKGSMESDLRYDTLGKDSEVITFGDPLAISSGVLLVATGTSIVVGVAEKTATMGATNDTVYPAYIPVTDDSIWLMGTDSDLVDNETNGGTYYNLTGLTGAVQVLTSDGQSLTTGRMVEIVKVDPNGVGGSGSGSGLRQVLVRFVKTPYTNIGIQA